MGLRALPVNYRQHEQTVVGNTKEVDTFFRQTKANSLSHAVIHEARKKIDILREQGLVGRDEPEDEMSGRIDNSLKDFFIRHEKGFPKRWNRRKYFQAAEWAVHTGVIRLNTNRDWSVDRKNPDSLLGLESIESLEYAITTKYGLPEPGTMYRCVDIGSGDNSNVYAANKDKNTRFEMPDGEEHPRNDIWEHVGYGNKLYTSIETLIGQFLKPEFRDESMYPNNPEAKTVIRVLTEALQNRLHERWFNPTGVEEKTTWQTKTDHCDFNDVFRLLAEPRALLKGIGFPEAVDIGIAKYQLSGRFAADSPVGVAEKTLADVEKDSLAAYRTLRTLSGLPQEVIEYESLSFELQSLKGGRSILLGFRKDFSQAEKSQKAQKKIPATLKNLEKWLKFDEKVELASQPDAETQRLKAIEMIDKIVAGVEVSIAEIDEGPGGGPSKIENAADKLTPEHTLLQRKHTLEWMLQELRQSDSVTAPRALVNICIEKLKIADVQRRMPIENFTQLVEGALEEAKTLLPDEEEAKGMSQAVASSILDKYFDPEFTNGIRRMEEATVMGTAEKKASERWELVNLSWMEGETEKVIEPVPENAVIRIDEEEMKESTFSVGMTGFTLRREGTQLIVNQGEAMPSRSGQESSFCLEIVNDLDLNSRPYAFFRNFIPGDFKEIDLRIPHGSCMLMKAVRSDSHVSDEEFAELIGRYLHILAPGGVLITEGIDESYTQILRLIDGLPKGLFRTQVVMNKTTHMPMSMIIQRNHPEGFLKEKELETALAQHSELRNVWEVRNRPDLEIRNEVLRELRTIFPRDAFRALEGQLDLSRTARDPSRMVELLIAAAAESYLAIGKDPSTRPKRKLEGVINSVAPGELPQAICDRLAEKHAQLLKTAGIHLVDWAHVSGNASSEPEKEALFKKVSELPHLVGKTVKQMRSELMKTCMANPRLASSETVAMYERAIVQSIADLVNARRKDKTYTSEDADPSDRQKIMQQFLDQSRNIDYGSPLINSNDRKQYLQRRIALRARRTMEKLMRREKGEEPRQTPGWVTYFTRKGAGSWEMPDVRTAALPSNEQHAGPEAAARIAEKMRQAKELADELHRVLRRPPIGFVNCRDCVTNEILLEKLYAIVGAENMDHVNCIFGKHPGTGSPGIANQRTFQRTFNGWTKEGDRIIVGGGSYRDSFDGYGMRLKDTIKGELAMAIAESKNVRAIGICFWNQILGDILGSAKMYGMDDKEGAHTMPGPLEIGLAGITPTGDGVTHPMFQDCSHPTTNIMSRGGHLRGNGIDEKKSSLLQILARSDASGTAAAWQWDGGRALGLQFHPEICIDEKRRKSRDVQRFLKELSSPLVLPMLQKTFDCDMDDVRDNFDYRQAQIAGDAGKEILVNSILFQLRGLKNDLGGMTTEQPRQAPHTSR